MREEAGTQRYNVGTDTTKLCATSRSASRSPIAFGRPEHRDNQPAHLEVGARHWVLELQAQPVSSSES